MATKMNVCFDVFLKFCVGHKILFDISLNVSIAKNDLN